MNIKKKIGLGLSVLAFALAGGLYAANTVSDSSTKAVYNEDGGTKDKSDGGGCTGGGCTKKDK